MVGLQLWFQSDLVKAQQWCVEKESNLIPPSKAEYCNHNNMLLLKICTFVYFQDFAVFEILGNIPTIGFEYFQLGKPFLSPKGPASQIFSALRD